MKLLKQPIVWIGAGALVMAIVIAIVTSALHPSSAVIAKYEKAMNKQDASLLAECMNPNEENLMDPSLFLQQLKAMLAMLRVNGDVEYEILIGNPDEVGEDLKTYPGVIVIKSGDKVVYMDVANQKIITVDGKEYLYSY